MSKSKDNTHDFINRFDRLPTRERFVLKVKEAFSSLAAFYGFEPIHTSLLEDPRLFGGLQKAGLMGERSPVICKTSLGVDLALRSSGAVEIFRAYTAHRMNGLPHPLKFLFEGESFFVSTRESDGHLDSVYELGLCMIGEEGPIAEAEIIQVLWKSLEKAGVDASLLNVRINATACNECRPLFRTPYLAYFRPRFYRLCKGCRRHLKRNPTKILNCKEEQCRGISQNAPQVLDYLCEVCKKHLRGVLEFLDEMRMSYFLDPKFFRDGSLFNSLNFEIALALPAEAVVEDGKEPTAIPGESMVLAEGGRMSKAGELVVGRRLDVACGVMILEAVERILARIGGELTDSPKKPRVFLAQLGELAKRKSLGLLEALRAGEISVVESLGRDSVKSQLNVAERIGAEVALILGQKEALDSTVIVREISSGIQETIPQDKLVEFLKRKLKR